MQYGMQCIIVSSAYKTGYSTLDNTGPVIGPRCRAREKVPKKGKLEMIASFIAFPCYKKTKQIVFISLSITSRIFCTPSSDP